MLPNSAKILLWAILVCTGVNVDAQQWHSTNSIPLFRGTPLQGVVVTNLQQSTVCINNLKQMGLAARIWSNEKSTNVLPSTFQQFTNELWPTALYCPKDTNHPPQTNWGSVNFSAISYGIVSPGASVDHPQTVYIECVSHTNRVFVDGAAKEAVVYNRDVPLQVDGGLRLFVPALNEAKRRALSISCINQLKQIGIAAQMFAIDNGLLPSSFAQITNDLGAPALLFCPAEQTNDIPSSFTQVNFSNVSYKILAPGASQDDPNVRYAECRTHGNYLLVDGSAQQGTNTSRRLIVGDPFSQTVEPGRRVELAVLVNTNSDQLPFRFQWRKQQPFDSQGRPFTNTVIINGATNRTLVFSNVQTSQEGYYDVVVRDAKGGYQESFMAYLRVEPLSSIKNAFAWETLCCMQNLKNIGIAARMWLIDGSGHYYPSNFYYLQHQLGWPLCLYCPNDTTRQPENQWSTVNFNNTSYILYTNVSEVDPTNVLARCKIHNFRLLSDGSVPEGTNFPSISQQPTSLTVTQGGTGTFSVIATGPNLFYHWKRNGTNVTSGTQNVLTLSNVTTNLAGQYTVMVSNSVGYVISQPATLTVLALQPPQILVSPINRSIFAGENTTFNVSVNGSNPLTFRWRLNGVSIPGATNQTYILSNAQPVNAGTYSVVVSNSVGTATSASCALTVYYRLSVSNTAGGIVLRNPNQEAILPNAQVTLTAITNLGSLFLGWSGGLSGTATSMTFSMNSHKAIVGNFLIPDVVVDNPQATLAGSWLQSDFASSRYGTNYQYHATVLGTATGTADFRPLIHTAGMYDVFIWYPEGGNRSTNSAWEVYYSGGMITTNINQTVTGGRWVLIGRQRQFAQGTNGFVRLRNNTGETGRFVMADAVAFVYSPTVSLAPFMVSQPQKLSVIAGQTAVMPAQAAGGGPLTYKWRKDAVTLSGGNEPMLRLINVQTNQSGKYSVFVTNQFGFIVSSEADLTVYPANSFRLTMTTTNTGVFLTWPTSVQCRLQVTTNLPGYGTWSDLNGVTSPYNVNPTANPRFFRLVAP